MSALASARPTLRVIEHHVLVYRRTWRGTIFSAFFSPVLFLVAMGVGLGSFVDEADPTALAGVPYLAFLAPGLLVAQAMQTAAFESTYPVMAGIRWLKTFVAMVLSPLSTRHVATGQLIWTGLRVTFGAAVFVAVMVAAGAIEPGRAALLLPVATLTGLAFAAPIQAFAAAQRSDNPFAALFRFVIMPMFIFSGTFFPISQLPEALQVVAVLTPLWHAVSLARGIALGTLEPALAAVNLAYLSALVVVGLLVSHRTFARKLAESPVLVTSRLIPTRPLGGWRAHKVLERDVLVYRHSWLVIVSGFFEPVFYLLGIGYGLGTLVGDVGDIPYAAFVAPGLMATTAMNGALMEATFNLFFKLRYAKTYDAILSTPLGPSDVAVGEVAWSLTRGLAYAIGFLVVMLALGLVLSPTGILAIPGALLIGLAAAAVGMAACTYMRKWQDFDLVAVVTTPMFLFSGTFFPITVYPDWLRVIVEVTPLYRGVHMLRSFTTGDVGPMVLLDVAYLGAMGVIGVAITSRRLRLLLLK